MTLTCDLGPGELRVAVACLAEVSKDLEGELCALGTGIEECRERDCKSLVTHHGLRARVKADGCDSPRSAPLDGDLVVDRLTTIFADGDPHGRGVHAGDLVWRSPGLLITGGLRGVTNAGISRPPLQTACEECRHPGVMIGRLSGCVQRAVNAPDLVGAVVTGIYRCEFEPTAEGGAGRILGVVEGALLLDCTPESPCPPC